MSSLRPAGAARGGGLGRGIGQAPPQFSELLLQTRRVNLNISAFQIPEPNGHDVGYDTFYLLKLSNVTFHLKS